MFLPPDGCSINRINKILNPYIKKLLDGDLIKYQQDVAKVMHAILNRVRSGLFKLRDFLPHGMKMTHSKIEKILLALDAAGAHMDSILEKLFQDVADGLKKAISELFEVVRRQKILKKS